MLLVVQVDLPQWFSAHCHFLLTAPMVAYNGERLSRTISKAVLLIQLSYPQLKKQEGFVGSSGCLGSRTPIHFGRLLIGAKVSLSSGFHPHSNGRQNESINRWRWSCAVSRPRFVELATTMGLVFH